MEETGKILQGYSVIETSVVKEEIQHSTHFTEQRKERKRRTIKILMLKLWNLEFVKGPFFKIYIEISTEISKLFFQEIWIFNPFISLFRKAQATYALVLKFQNSGGKGAKNFRTERKYIYVTSRKKMAIMMDISIKFHPYEKYTDKWRSVVSSIYSTNKIFDTNFTYLSLALPRHTCLYLSVKDLQVSGKAESFFFNGIILSLSIKFHEVNEYSYNF